MVKIDIQEVYTGTSVLIAAINETFSLEQTVRVIQDTCTQQDVVEVLLLLSEKKSTSPCIEAAQKLVAEQRSIPVSIVWQTLPFAGGAYRDGFCVARGSHVIMMSADLETDPNLVHGIVAASKANPSAVVTMSRWVRGGGFTGYSNLKRICNSIFQKLLSVIFWTRLTDLTYAYRCFPSELMRKIAWQELRHPFFLETALVPLRLGVSFVELPAQWKPRREAESQNSFFANFNYFMTAFRVRFATRQSLLISTEKTK